jgi:protein arginine N-methyltransferase 1
VTFADIRYHAAMIDDRSRVLAYRDAIEQAVRPGDVVADLGTGTGLLAALCLEAGASRVHCVDRLPVIQLAKQLIDAQGWADRVVLHETEFDQVELRESVDVMVSEVLGSLGPGESSFASLARFRDRFLGPSGRIIPESLDVEAAPVTDAAFARYLSFDVARELGLDYEASTRLAVNQVHGHRVPPEALLGPPAPLHRIDFRSVAADEADVIDAAVTVPVEQAGELHGVAGWFTAQLFGDVSLSNGPGAAQSHWPNAFFPIAAPVSVLSGDMIDLGLRMDLSGADHFVFRWAVHVVRDGEEVAGSTQDTFTGQLLSSRQVHVAAGDVPARPTEQGLLARFVLDQTTGGGATGGDIVAAYAQHVGRPPDKVAPEVERMIRRCRQLGDLA